MILILTQNNDHILDILLELKIQVVEREEDLENLIDDSARQKDEGKSQKKKIWLTYLKSMSTVKLLTREDEVSIAMKN